MTLRVAPFEGSPAEWNALLAGAPAATHCHRHEWLGVIGETFGHQTFAWGAWDPAGALVGVLPLVRVRTPLFGHYLVSMPFLNAGGPLGSTDAVKALAVEASRLAAAERPRLLELRSRDQLPIGLRVSHRKITVILDLPATGADLSRQLPSKLRSQVRRPQKEGVEARFGSDLVGDFYRVFAIHMRDLGTPVLPKRFFELAGQRFGDDAWFGCCYLAGEPIACGAGFRFRDSFELTWASSLRRFNRLAPNMFLYWAFLERAVEHGIREFDFGRCTPGGGTHRFKQQWGGRDVQLWWYQDGRDSATPSPDQGVVMALATKVWSRLPVRLTTALGPGIVRGIP